MQRMTSMIANHPQEMLMGLGTLGYTALEQQEAPETIPLFQTILWTFGNTTLSFGEFTQLLLGVLTLGAFGWKIISVLRRKRCSEARRHDD